MRSVSGAGGIDELGQMEQWLQNVAADTATADPQERVIVNRPADLNDVCFSFDGTAIEEEFTYDDPGLCNMLFPNHGDPRIAAGAPVANDIVKCQLQSFSANDYGPDFSDAQLARLGAVFEKGVCDWAQPGVAQSGISGTDLHY